MGLQVGGHGGHVLKQRSDRQSWENHWLLDASSASYIYSISYTNRWLSQITMWLGHLFVHNQSLVSLEIFATVKTFCSSGFHFDMFLHVIVSSECFLAIRALFRSRQSFEMRFARMLLHPVELCVQHNQSHISDTEYASGHGWWSRTEFRTKQRPT